jgi:signal transduction histidine kinase
VRSPVWQLVALMLGLIACADVLVIAGVVAALALLSFVATCVFLTYRSTRLLATERQRIDELEAGLQDRLAHVRSELEAGIQDRLARLRREHEHSRELLERERRALSHHLAQAQRAAADQQHALAGLNTRVRKEASVGS